MSVAHTDPLSFATPRSLDNYIPVPESGCWIYTGEWSEKGYGSMHIEQDGRRRKTGAHRVFYAAHVGPIGDGLQVCHKCDTPACVNPDHLFLGTNTDNSLDRERKGRGRRVCVLNADSALLVHRDSGSFRAIAKKYGISDSTVRNIKHGIHWREVTGQARRTPRPVSPPKSGVKGVSWDEEVKKWRVKIVVSKRTIQIGYFDDLALAGMAFANAAHWYRGNSANQGATQ